MIVELKQKDIHYKTTTTRDLWKEKNSYRDSLKWYWTGQYQKKYKGHELEELILSKELGEPSHPIIKISTKF